ncbi:MAG TPA: glycoside hydrolase family 3 C-terminal domain-containing protein [Terracidiphilus sp.]|nr:glycoside hydrolase family 3 C-terminal domain-containing protein [Terracidiphilus sp.]
MRIRLAAPAALLASLALNLVSVLAQSPATQSPVTPQQAVAAPVPPPVPADAPYKNASLPVDQRVADLLSLMTLPEKISMLAGSGWMESTPIPRLGIPAIKMADGPMGVRAWYGSSALTSAANASQTVYATAFPSGICMGATWDPALVQKEGAAIGQETKALGRDMILGPTININREPLWGRNFEGYGEDPYLTSRLGVAYVRGVQSEGVIPSVKHFVANNEEYERHRIDESISQRALREIYLPAFKAAVQEGGAWNVMSAYQLVNGAHMAENQPLLRDILEKEFGFQGFVVSDWGSTYSTAPTVNAGMDLEMPGGEPAQKWIVLPQTVQSGNGDLWLTPDKVQAEITAGHITQAQLDDNVSRILRVLFASGLFDHPHPGGGDVDTPEQRAIALKGATEGIVLLKNDAGLLPLDPAKIRSIAVIGPNAAVARTGGGGSSNVRPKTATAPLEAIQKRAGSALTVTYALGAGMEGEDPAHDTPEARAADLQQAVEAASHADAAILVVGRSSKIEHESADLPNMDLPAGQDALIQAVEKANPHTVVVLNTGNPVTMTPWIDSTPALLDMWYGGQEGGEALAAILFGDADPSGKLPVTFPKRFEDCPCYGHYPGENLKVDYAEGIYVGYRHYDTKDVAPQFPFGFGLSYTTFQYDNLGATPRLSRNGSKSNFAVSVDLSVQNTGTRPGAEVVQIYIHPNKPRIDRPVHELKAFQRIELQPGETRWAHFHLDESAFSYWNPATNSWTTDPGEYEIEAGSSSRDIRQKKVVNIPASFLRDR